MSNGIDFVIGGKNKAGPAMGAVEKSLARLEQKSDKLAVSTKRLAAVTGVLAAAYGAVKAGLALLGGIDKINAAYDQQVAAVKGLEVALGLQGAAVDQESSRLQTFAGDMQKLTGVGDEVTLSLMKQASMLGVSTEQLDDAAKAAIGLSEATGKSLDESLKLVKNSLEGEFGAFGEIIPAIKTMATEEEKLAAVLALSTKGLEAKTAASNTVEGMSGRASGAIGDLMESVGALIAPVRLLINQGLLTLAESLQSVLAPAVEYASKLLENIGPLMDWVKEKVVAGVNLMIGAFTFFEVVIGNLDKIWIVMVSQAELYLLQMSGAVMHTLTVVIPEYASWFGRNFVNIIKDAFMAVATVIGNAGSMIADIVKEMWQYVFVSMGDGTSTLSERIGAILSQGLAEGFESSVESLPEIAGRKISEREKQLAETVGQIGSDLGEEFSTKFAERMIGIGDGLSDEFDKEIDLKVNKKLNEGMGGSGGGGGGPSVLQAAEGRLLTRGPVEKRKDLGALLEQLISVTKQGNDEIVESSTQIKERLPSRPFILAEVQ